MQWLGGSIQASFISALAILTAATLAILVQVRGKALRLRASAITEAKARGRELGWFDNDDYLRRSVEAKVSGQPTAGMHTAFFANNVSVTLSEADSITDSPQIAAARTAEKARRASLGLIPVPLALILVALTFSAWQWIALLIAGLCVATTAFYALRN